MPAVEIFLNERRYRIGCGEGQEHRLRMMADYVNERMQTLKEQVGDVPESQLLAITAMSLVDGLLEEQEALHQTQQDKEQELQKEITKLRQEKQTQQKDIQQKAAEDFKEEKEKWAADLAKAKAEIEKIRQDGEQRWHAKFEDQEKSWTETYETMEQDLKEKLSQAEKALAETTHSLNEDWQEKLKTLDADWTEKTTKIETDWQEKYSQTKADLKKTLSETEEQARVHFEKMTSDHERSLQDAQKRITSLEQDIREKDSTYNSRLEQSQKDSQESQDKAVAHLKDAHFKAMAALAEERDEALQKYTKTLRDCEHWREQSEALSAAVRVEREKITTESRAKLESERYAFANVLEMMAERLEALAEAVEPP